MRANRLRVLVVEDHPVTRLGLATVLRGGPTIDVVAEASTLSKTFEIAASCPLDLIVLDLLLPDGNALTHIKRLCAIAPDAKVLVVTGAGTEEHARIALREGAAGFVTKDIDGPSLVRAVYGVAGGRRVVASALLVAPEESGRRPVLSTRELEILALMVEGFTNVEIGRMLGLATGTVRTHVSHVLEKLDVTDRTEAAAVAIRRGLV